MVDIRIRGGRVQTPAGTVEADVLITGERIAALVTRGDDTPAREVIDATDLLVLPGLIDLHAHTRVPGFTHKEDYVTASQAAAHGGITTFVDMPNVDPPTDSAELMLEKKAVAERDCIVDWGHFGSGSKPENVPALAAAGAAGFKIFMIGGGYPHDDRIAVYENDRLYQAFEAIARTGLPVMVHPFNQGLFNLWSKRALAEQPGVDAFKVLSEVYTRDALWRTGVRTLLELQKDTGVRLQVLHTHAAGSLRMLKEAKAAGQRVTVALDVKYFHIKRDDLDRVGIRAAPGGFVTVDAERMRVIWESLADGTVDCIDSDHAPHTLEEVKKIWSAQGGSPQYDTELMILLNDVNLGVLSLETLVRVTAENPARMLGIYPEKGAILPGSLADLVLVDMAQERELRDEDTYTKLKWTPFLGWRVKGVPVLTMLRGRVIARDHTVVGEPGYGRFVPGRPQRWVDPAPGLSPGLALAPEPAAAAV